MKGAIDYVDEERISGWVFLENGTSGRTLLVFDGDRCVGSGEATAFRQDILDAGLGDGRCGFNLIHSAGGESIHRLFLKFEGSDFTLAQTRYRDRVEKVNRSDGLSSGTVEWLQLQGFLHQGDYSVLRDVTRLGYAVYALPSEQPEQALVAEAGRLLELAGMHTLRLRQEEIPLSGVQQHLNQITRNPELALVIALYASEGRLDLLEGSHQDHREIGIDPPSVHQLLRKSRLLLLDSRVRVAPTGSLTCTLFTGQRV